MRRIILALLLSLALPVAAQSTPPKKLVPIPEPPEMPLPSPSPSPGTEQDASLEPQVTIIKRGEDTVEEYRSNGRLYMIKVTPRIGLPYYLIDNRGDGTFATRSDMDQGIRPPMWVIHQF
ncbi:MAG: DUF2782 domain-containing protein [Pseudomonadota bacterium]